MPAYVPIVFNPNTSLSATEFQSNLVSFRELVNSTGLEQSNFADDTIDSDRINQYRFAPATDTGYTFLFESGLVETRGQFWADLRAPALSPIWFPGTNWSFVDPETQRNINTANRAVNGVVKEGVVPGCSATIQVSRPS